MILDALALWARGQGAEWLWLEVRTSNRRAQEIYNRLTELNNRYHEVEGRLRDLSTQIDELNVQLATATGGGDVIDRERAVGPRDCPGRSAGTGNALAV